MWDMAYKGVPRAAPSRGFWGDSGGPLVVPYVGVEGVLSSDEIPQP